MIDLTPLDVRKKRGDFRKVLRGYDADEVDGFIEMVAERLETLVKENLTLRERTDRLQEQVSHQEEREHAVREALVTAQELRRDVREQARREADLLLREAEVEVERSLEDARRRLDERRDALAEMERLRLRFLKSFRGLLERELDAVEVEEARKPLEDSPLEIDFTVGDLRERVENKGDDPGATLGGPRSDGPGAGGPGSGGSDAGEPEGAGSGGEEAGENWTEELGASLMPPEEVAGSAGGDDAAEGETAPPSEQSTSQPEENRDGPEADASSPPEGEKASSGESRPAGGETEGVKRKGEESSLWLSPILEEEESAEPKGEDGW